MLDREERAFEMEMRVTSGEDKPTRLEGYSAMFNKKSEDLGGFVEIIEPGTFTKTIKESDIRALFNHDKLYVLGRNRANTLELKEDKTGLHVNILPPDNQLIRDLVISPIERKDITQMSFGFRMVKDVWETDNEIPLRRIKEVKLFDVSPVTYPAYPQTSVKVREQIVQAGFNPDAIFGILAREERGAPVSDADRATLKEAIQFLNQRLSTEPGQVTHSDDDKIKPGRVAMLKRRLALSELDL